MLGVLVLGLSGSHKAGLLIVAGAFIAFAAVAAIVVPARWPEFPGRGGLGPFIVTCSLFFVGMMFAVFFLARESEEPGERGGGTETTGRPSPPLAVHTVHVRALEHRFDLTLS